MTAPLEGMTVITMEHAVAAPYATRQLLDMGARVIKIERPDGGDFARTYDSLVDGLATYFVWLNRGKESVALDVKDPAAREVVLRLIDRADVFVQNLSPGAAARLGLDAGSLRARNPRLVVCDISGYGPDGPYADKRAYDLLVQCEGGLASVTGKPGVLAKAGTSVADLSAGAYAFSGVLAALLRRERTGEGASLSIAMLDTVAEWMTFSTLYSRSTGKPHEPHGLGHPSLVPYDGFTTADGTVVVLGVQNDREWVRLANALGRPDAAADERFASAEGRARHRTEVDAVVADRLAMLSTEEAMALLESAGIANGRVRTSVDLLSHPQLAARNRWRDTPTSVGPVPVLLPPITIEGYEAEYRKVPDLGEHTAAVLRELDLGDDEITALTA
ncbi:MAG: CoA transferase [Acidobacteria bacterium]|nr:CoA transferase [Acidobacteriota bacterium]